MKRTSTKVGYWAGLLRVGFLFFNVAGLSFGIIRAAPGPGTVDPTFAPDLSSFSKPGEPSPSLRVVVQTDGRILVQGGDSLARLGVDGSREFLVRGSRGPQYQSRGQLIEFNDIKGVRLHDDGRILVWGTFGALQGRDQPQLARLTAGGQFDESFRPQVGALRYDPAFGLVGPQIRWALPLQDGKVLVAGDLSVLTGQNGLSLARLQADGRIDPAFDAGAALRILGVSQPDQLQDAVEHVNGELTVSSESEGIPRRQSFARLALNGSLNPFVRRLQATGNFVNGILRAEDGSVVVWGYFESFEGEPARAVARILPDGSFDKSFQPVTGNEQTTPSVTSVAVQPDGKLVVGGEFTAINGIPRARIARLNPDGTTDLGFVTQPGPDASVISVGWQPDGAILVSGGFSRVGGMDRPRVARLVGGTQTGEPPQIVEAPKGAAVREGDTVPLRVLVSSFEPPAYQWLLNGRPRIGAIRPELRVRRAGPFDQGDYQVVVRNSAGAVTSGPVRIEVRTHASFAGAVRRDFDQDPLRSRSSAGAGEINGLFVGHDGKTVISGNFSEIGGMESAGVARLEIDGSLDSTFDARSLLTRSPGASFRRVFALGEDGSVWVAQNSNYFYPNRVIHLIRLHPTGRIDPGFNAVLEARAANMVEAHIRSLALLPDGRVLCGGTFDAVNERPHTNLVRLLRDGRVDETFRYSPWNTFDSLDALAIQADGKILVGRAFVSGDSSRSPLHRLNADGSFDSTFRMPPMRSFAIPSVHHIILLPDQKILMAGHFTHVWDQPRASLARLHPDGTLDSTFQPPEEGVLDFTILAVLRQQDGRFFAIPGNIFTPPRPSSSA